MVLILYHFSELLHYNKNLARYTARRTILNAKHFLSFPAIMSIHIKDFDDLKNRLAEAGEKLVVIDFMATWCGPCKMIGPKLDEIASEMADSIVVLKVSGTSKRFSRKTELMRK